MLVGTVPLTSPWWPARLLLPSIPAGNPTSQPAFSSTYRAEFQASTSDFFDAGLCSSFVDSFCPLPVLCVAYSQQNRTEDGFGLLIPRLSVHQTSAFPGNQLFLTKQLKGCLDAGAQPFQVTLRFPSQQDLCSKEKRLMPLSATYVSPLPTAPAVPVNLRS